MHKCIACTMHLGLFLPNSERPQNVTNCKFLQRSRGCSTVNAQMHRMHDAFGFILAKLRAQNIANFCSASAGARLLMHKCIACTMHVGLFLAKLRAVCELSRRCAALIVQAKLKTEVQRGQVRKVALCFDLEGFEIVCAGGIYTFFFLFGQPLTF